MDRLRSGATARSRLTSTGLTASPEGRHGGHENGSGESLIGERRAVQAFLQARPLSRGSLEVELRAAPQTSDPRSGEPVLVPPLVVLWIEERPVAVRVRTVVAMSRFPPEPPLVSMLEADCLAAGLAVERIPEAASGACSRTRRGLASLAADRIASRDHRAAREARRSQRLHRARGP